MKKIPDEVGTKDYPIMISKLSKEDGGGYLAKVLWFDEVFGTGETPEEATADFKEAFRSFKLTQQDLSTFDKEMLDPSFKESFEEGYKEFLKGEIKS